MFICWYVSMFLCFYVGYVHMCWLCWLCWACLYMLVMLVMLGMWLLLCASYMMFTHLNRSWSKCGRNRRQQASSSLLLLEIPLACACTHCPFGTRNITPAHHSTLILVTQYTHRENSQLGTECAYDACWCITFWRRRTYARYSIQYSACVNTRIYHHQHW